MHTVYKPCTSKYIHLLRVLILFVLFDEKTEIPIPNKHQTKIIQTMKNMDLEYGLIFAKIKRIFIILIISCGCSIVKSNDLLFSLFLNCC